MTMNRKTLDALDNERAEDESMIAFLEYQQELDFYLDAALAREDASRDPMGARVVPS